MKDVEGEMEISVIIPIYNARKTLKKTLEALRLQQIQDIEFLLIDNNSTDDSGVICKEYVEADQRFRYLMEKQKGVSAARNCGLANATGRFICFCDADDLPNPEMYNKLYYDITHNDVDIVMCNYFSERDQKKSLFPDKFPQMMKKDQIKDYLLPALFGEGQESGTVWGTVWRCILKKKVIQDNNLCFDTKLSFAEDLCFVMDYLQNADSVFLEDEDLYFYSYTPGSAMLSYAKYRSELFEERVHLITKLSGLLKKAQIYEEHLDVINSIFQEYILECIGNASNNDTGNNLSQAHERVKNIVESSTTKHVFKHVTVRSTKKLIVYTLIKYRFAWLLTLYYRKRRK